MSFIPVCILWCVKGHVSCMFSGPMWHICSTFGRHEGAFPYTLVSAETAEAATTASEAFSAKATATTASEAEAVTIVERLVWLIG